MQGSDGCETLRQDLSNRYEWYEGNRRRKKLWFNRERQSWMVFSYDTTREILTDDNFIVRRPTPAERLSDATGQDFEYLKNFFLQWLLFTDPPGHTEKRRSLQRGFTSRKILEFEENILLITNHRLQKLDDVSHLDIGKEILQPIASEIILTFLEIETVSAEEGISWAREFYLFLVNKTPSHRDAGIMQASLQELVGRIKRSKSLFLRNLLTRNSEREDAFLLASILVDSVEPLAAALESATYLLMRDNEILERVMADQHLSNEVICHLLRRESPFQCIVRIAKSSCKVSGQRIRKGEKITLFIGSANRDLGFFGTNHCLSEHERKHVSFGAGVHTCLGAPLAKSVISMVVPMIARKILNGNFCLNSKVIWRPISGLRQPEALILTKPRRT